MRRWQEYLLDLGERVIGAFASGFLSTLAFGESGINVFMVDWRAGLGIGAGAALVSLLKGVASRFTRDSSTASIRSRR